MVKPKIYEVEFLEYGTEIKEGDAVTICEEFTSRPPFKSFLIGEVTLLTGEKRLLSLNKTSYKAIASKYGKDTVDWIGKTIIYVGEKKMGQMMGKLWEAI